MNSFVVYGTPVPKGSTRALQGIPYGKPCKLCRQQKRGFPRVFSANQNLAGWEKLIRGAAGAADIVKLAGPVEIDLVFHMPRLKSHYRTGKFSHLLKDSAPIWHVAKPDLDKLERAVFDPMTDICFGDDSTVVKVSAIKIYSETPGVLIRYREAKYPECDLRTALGEPLQAELPGLLGTKTSDESM